jgi:RNA polymerase sigma-70 factor (ECF subfamily)
MKDMVRQDSSAMRRRIEQAAGGDQDAWRSLVERYRDRLRRMVILRLDPRLRGRLDASDVLQDVYLEASRQLADYLDNPVLPFFLWLRQLAGNRLFKLHRYHLIAQVRDAGRDVSLYSRGLPEASSAALAAQLLGRECRPSEAAVRAELKLRLEEALNLMDPLDRESLVLRHFEQLTTAEVASVLDISEAAAGKRYLRALGRLKVVLAQVPGGLREWHP